MIKVLPHAEDSLKAFISKSDSTDEDKLIADAQDFIKGWESCVDTLVSFAQTSKEVPGLFRKKLGSALNDARCVTNLENKTVVSKEFAQAGWVACIDYIGEFVATSNEVPGMFKKKITTALMGFKNPQV